MKVLILRKCTKKLKSHSGLFQYPQSGWVEAPDWKKTPECGNGLHGLLWGRGNFNLEDYGSVFQVIECKSDDVIECKSDDVIEFDGKCKFRGGEVLFTGDQLGAITLIKAHPNFPPDTLLNYNIATGGYGSTLKGGYGSTLKGGDESTLTGGDESTLTGGYESTLTGGDGSTLKGGYGSTLKGGYGSTLTGGYGSVFIVQWFNKDKYAMAVKKITKKTAGKTFYFKVGKFVQAKEDQP